MRKRRRRRTHSTTKSLGAGNQRPGNRQAPEPETDQVLLLQVILHVRLGRCLVIVDLLRPAAF